MVGATRLHTDIDPSTYAVVFSTSRILWRAVNESAGVSLTEYRILSCIVSSERVSGSAIARALDLPRSAVSMSLASLREKRLVERMDESDGAAIAPTLKGRQAYRIAHEAIDSAIESDLPILLESERKTLGSYLVMMADRLGASIMSNAEVDKVHLMVETNTRVKRILKRSVASCGLSSNGFLILSGLINFTDGKARPSELAACTRLGRPDVTHACRELERDSYIALADDPQDRRGKIATCTPKGRGAFETASQVFWDEFATRVRGLNDEEFAFFTDINTRRR